MKFYEAAKYYYYPGFHEPGGVTSFGMNASWWGSSDRLGACCHHRGLYNEETAAMYEETAAFNGEYLNKLVTEHGVELKQFTEDARTTPSAKHRKRSTRKPAATRNWQRKIHDEFMKNRNELAGWQAIAEVAFSVQRNRVLGIGG